MTRKVILFTWVLNSFILSHFLHAQINEKNNESENSFTKTPYVRSHTSNPPPAKNFESFTGKVEKSKVRLRLQPHYDAQVIKEIEPGELFVVTSENEDFYAVKPPSDLKAYIFRTFVLDNVVEGNRVNVRLKPDLEAPVIAQLNSGDKIEGKIDAENHKWLEIVMPSAANFYIAKEYVEKVGDANYLTKQEKRRQDVDRILENNLILAQQEFQKPFNEIQIENLKSSYQRIISDYKDYPEAVSKAEEGLTALLQTYTDKKIAFLESQTRFADSKLNDAQKLNHELQLQKSKVADLQQQLEQNRSYEGTNCLVITPSRPQSLPLNMSSWIPQEDGCFAAWSQQTGNYDINYFYQEQLQHAIYLKGIVEPYTRPIKNKPGDYMLINPISQLPLAYLYSTQINLQDYVGHEVTVRVSARPNNHFAYPAYFVLSIE